MIEIGIFIGIMYLIYKDVRKMRQEEDAWDEVNDIE